MKIITALAAVAVPVALAASLAVAPVGATSSGPASASDAGLAVGDEVGRTEVEIRASLEAAGKTIREIETEDGKIEVEYAMNGGKYEIKVDRETGRVTKVESYGRRTNGDDDHRADRAN